MNEMKSHDAIEKLLRCGRLPYDDGGQRGIQVTSERPAVDGGHVQQPGDEEPVALSPAPLSQRTRRANPALDQILMKFIILSVIPNYRYSIMRLENTDYDRLIMKMMERALYFELLYPFLRCFVTFRALEHILTM